MREIRVVQPRTSRRAARLTSPVRSATVIAVFPVVIPGPRVTLRQFRADDLDASMTVVGDPEVTRTLSFDARSRDDQAERLAQDIARAQSQARPDHYLAIANGDDMLIGFIRIGLGRDDSGELGYAVRREDWGTGYATEAALLMLGFGSRPCACTHSSGVRSGQPRINGPGSR